MDKRTFYFVLYVYLLTMTAPALCFKQRLHKQLSASQRQGDKTIARQRRHVAVLPIASYIGTAVSPQIFLALVAAYGIAMVIRKGIRYVGIDDIEPGRRGNNINMSKSSNYHINLNKRQAEGYSRPEYSHNCANNRGWCRPRCHSNEWIDYVNGAYICRGGTYCCRHGSRPRSRYGYSRRN